MHTAIGLAPDLASASRARRLVEWFANELRIDSTAASIVVTELVTNAVRHGAEPIVLRLRTDGRSWLVEVSDRGSGVVRAAAPGDLAAHDEGGLGLVLVERLSTDWGVRGSTRHGKTVWAALDVAPCVDGASVDGARTTERVLSR